MTNEELAAKVARLDLREELWDACPTVGAGVHPDWRREACEHTLRMGEEGLRDRYGRLDVVEARRRLTHFSTTYPTVTKPRGLRRAG
jgi:hypothetical protein